MDYVYTIDPYVNEPIMLIDTHIGDIDGEMGISGKRFARELMMLDAMGKPSVQVWINSIGGSIMEAMAIYSAISNCKAKVKTYNMGVAASSAAFIFQAGYKRVSADYSLTMIHNPFNPDGGDDDVLSKFKDSILTMLTSKCGKSRDEVSAMMDKETWMDAWECLDGGFCDEIEAYASDLKLDSIPDIKNKWQSARQYVNAAIDNKKTAKMNKVLNFLNLSEAANEDAALEAVKSLKAQADDATEKLQNAANELATLKAEKEALEAKITELEASEAAAKDAALTVEAEAVVNTYKNRIGDKAEALTKWVNLYKADAEGTKELLEALPLNVKAPNTEAITHTATAQYNMAYEMAKRANNTKK